MKKNFSLLIIGAILLRQIPIKPFYAEEMQVMKNELEWINVPGIEGGKIKFNINTGTIIEAEETISIAHIPEQINGITVTSIGDLAFEWCRDLISLSMPNTVETIGDRAFFSCINLTNVVIPEGVVSIRGAAFLSCEQLKTISLPSSLNYVEQFIFDECSSLEIIYYGSNIDRWHNLNIPTLPSTRIEVAEDWLFVPGIEGGMIKFDKNTGTITDTSEKIYLANIPQIIDNVTVIAIGNEAFYNCDNLKSVSLPGSITSIGKGAFENCNNLTTINIPDGITHIRENTFWECVNLKTIMLSENITHIEDKAFFGCDKLENMLIPKNVTNIGDFAFSGCSSLEIVVILGAPSVIGKDTFNYCNNLKKIYYDGNEIQWKLLKTDVANNTEIICNNDVEFPNLPYEKLSEIETTNEATLLLINIISNLTKEQYEDRYTTELLTCYVEEIIAQIASTTIEDLSLINYEAITELAQEAVLASKELSKILTAEGIILSRDLECNIMIKTLVKENSPITIHSDITQADIDNLRLLIDDVEIAIDKNKITKPQSFEISLEKVDDKYNISYFGEIPITIALPIVESDAKYQAIFKNNEVIGGNLNPATDRIEVKIQPMEQITNFNVAQNKKYFSDLTYTSTQIQEAINVLASKGIINGKQSEIFAPNDFISREEIAIMLTKIIHEDDVTANEWYKDITYDDNTFKGYDIISKEQIIVIVARVLQSEKNYIAPENPDEYISKYNDALSISDWAKADIALATQEEIVRPQIDGTFRPNSAMTRGEAALILKKLFDRVR